MRKAPTRSEAILWRALRGGALGVRFRRQHPVPPFIADFYCASHKLVVEIDGAVHDKPDARRADAYRQAALEQLYGVRVLRVRAWMVERDLDAALRLIVEALHR